VGADDAALSLKGNAGAKGYKTVGGAHTFGRVGGGGSRQKISLRRNGKRGEKRTETYVPEGLGTAKRRG